MIWENVWINFSGQDLALTLLLGFTGLMWVLQMFWMLFFFRRVGVFKTAAADHPPLPISVIIAARNEYHYLIKNLPLFLEQDYPEFEVVLVNHASDDETEDYLKSMVLKYPHLNVVTIHSDLNFFRGKKFPLGLGIKSAKYDNLLFTDADCRPASPHWIREMQACFDDQTDIVLGYGAYRPQKGLLNMLIRWETVYTAMQYLSFAMARMPYMGVGRNMAYRRSLYDACKGFLSHYNIRGGDDDLFVNQNATSGNTRVCLTHDSMTYSAPSRTYREWIRQKRRHITTGKFYKGKHRALLAVWPLTTILMIIGVLVLALQPFNLVLLAFMLLTREVTYLCIFKKIMIKLSEKKLLLFSLLMEPFFFFFYPAMALLNLLKRAPQWK